MKKKYLLFCVLILSMVLTACSFSRIPRAKVTFKVMDYEGAPIANEPLLLNFSFIDGYYGKTDENGYFTGSGRATKDYIFTIGYRSDRYYKSVFRKKIAHWENKPITGRWKPWNETIEVVVKERKNPISMYAVNHIAGQLKVPAQGKWLGYDFEQYDWLQPHGEGKVADIEVYFTTEYYDKGWRRHFLKLRFPYPQAGAYVMQKDHVSELKSIYHADKNQVYQQEFSFYGPVVKDRASFVEDYRDGQHEKKTVTKDEYLIFRTRTRVDKDGNLIGARYGKIYGPISCYSLPSLNADKIGLAYYLNPNINDTNLEFNGRTLVDTTKFERDVDRKILP